MHATKTRIVYNTCEIKVLQIYEDGKENGRCHDTLRDMIRRCAEVFV